MPRRLRALMIFAFDYDVKTEKDNAVGTSLERAQFETGASFDKYLVGKNDARRMPLNQLRQFFTFVPQEGFIMSATLRENVAFDYDVKTEKDNAVGTSLERAQFEWRRERLRAGLETEIGERGVNLSGGQKQRVSLARVDYYASPIVLLDDCLSAVDVDTENKLIESLFDGAWKKRTRILVTHRLTVLNKVDRILFMENGRITAEGSFAELMKNHAPFREYAASVQNIEVTPNKEETHV
jgi:ABC-type multidrug transport system fused ATPase/permease subunit